MSGLREQVATALWNSIDDKGIKGRLYQEDCDYLAEIAVKVTERAVRDTIAQQLEAARPDLRQYLGLWKRSDTLIDATTPDEAATDVLDNLTRIAREGTTP